MHSVLYMGSLAIALAATAAAHGASTTFQNGTNTFTSEQSGGGDDPANETLSTETSHGRVIIHQRNGGNSVDFSVSGNGNTVHMPTPDTTTPDTTERDVSDADAQDQGSQAADQAPDDADAPVRVDSRDKQRRDREALDFVRRHASPTARANLGRLLHAMEMTNRR